MCLFSKVAPEHARGFGFSEEDCAKPVMAPRESGRHCNKINTTECTVYNPHFVYTMAVLIQLLILTIKTSISELRHESPALLVRGDKKTIEMRRERAAVNKDWQMEREAEDVESACNINKNKKVCVFVCVPAAADHRPRGRFHRADMHVNC